LAARRENELERVKNDLIKKNLPNTFEPELLLIDLNQIDNIKTKIQSISDDIDILVNNGGISYRGCALDTSLDVDQYIMMTNYFGSIAITKGLC